MAKTAGIKVRSEPSVIMEAEVARKIRQHARTSMKAEVCGVLIGTNDSQRTVVGASIPGTNAAQGGAHVTFTQDTWEHIYKIKDEEFPDEKIVGWYHSHPGFGVFLSEHDLFIQENFFSNAGQIAWVYDPHTDEEGCFGWVNGKIEKLSGLRFGYSQPMEAVPGAASNDYVEDVPEGFLPDSSSPQNKSREPAWVRWTINLISYTAVLVLGLLLGYQYFQYRLDKFLQEQQRLYDQMLTPSGQNTPDANSPPPANSTPHPPAHVPQQKKGKR